MLNPLSLLLLPPRCVREWLRACVRCLSVWESVSCVWAGACVHCVYALRLVMKALLITTLMEDNNNQQQQQQRTTNKTRHNQSWPCCCQSISNRQRRIFACQSRGEPSPVWTVQTAAAAGSSSTRHLTILPRRVITTGHAECRRLIDRSLDRPLIMIRYDRKFMYCACVDCQLFRHNYSNG